MQFLIGTGKSQIICFKKNIGMMGYGMSANTVQDASTEISARSLWIEDNSKNVFIYTCAEICFVTPAIRREVLSRITSELDSDFDPAYLMLSAQHTHSAPGGYSEYALYNFTIPGFHQEVFDGIVNGIFESIKQAHSSVEPGTMDLVEHRIESEPAIAWNRSLDAYNANPENAEVCKEDAHLAIDNRMRMLRVFRNEIACGQVNWFGVHATCIGKTNHLVSSDNKGYASQHFENEGREFGIFAQGLAGDVSPYYHGPGDVAKRRMIQGEGEHEYARINGIMQAKEAEKAFKSDKRDVLEGEIDAELVYYDFSDIQVEDDFSNGDKNAKTGPACHGVSFFNGTRIDGRGLSNGLNATAKLLSVVVKLGHSCAMPFKTSDRKMDWREKYRIQGKKKIMMDASEHRILGTTNLKGLLIPGFADPTIAEIKREHNREAISEHQWVPHVLPLQIVLFGKLALIGCPGEYTVTAGKRLERTILSVLRKRGVEKVIMCPYSNAYMGYVTTFEEYQLQNYEGGHTVYGQWTLGAFQTKYKELAQAMLITKDSRQLNRETKPVIFSEMEKRTY